MTVAMVALGIGTGITTGIATGIAMAPVGISKQGFYFNPVVMGDSSLWHNNALQCIEMKSRNFRHTYIGVNVIFKLVGACKALILTASG